MKFRHLNYMTPILLIIFLLSFAPLAEALTFDNRAVFESQYSSSIPQLTFDGLGYGIVDTQYASSGVTFEGGETNLMSPDALFAYENMTPASITGTFSIDVNFIGFDFFSISPLTLEAYGSGDVLLESFMSTSNSGFLGVATGNENIDYFIVHDSGHNFVIDNVLFGSNFVTTSTVIPGVPEPSTLILLGGGLLGLGVCRKKLKL